MDATSRVKITVSLDAGLLHVVDRLAAREGTNRSAALELLLRQSRREEKAARPKAVATVVDRGVLTAAERAEDAAWAALSARAARAR